MRCAANAIAPALRSSRPDAHVPSAAPRCLRQDEDGEEEMDDELQDETEEEFDGDQTEPEY